MPTQEELAAAQAVIDAAKEEKVTFDEKQQAKVEALIKGAKSAAAKELREERDALKTEVDSVKAELAKAVDALNKAKTPNAKKEAEGDIEALKAEITEIKRASEAKDAEFKRLQDALDAKSKEVQTVRGEALLDRKRAAITAAATEANFVNPAMVVTLTAENVKWNDELSRWVVLNEQGVERKNSAFEPMTLTEFYAEYAAQNKFLVRGDVRPGAGSAPSGGVRGTAEVDIYFGPNADPKAKHTLANSGSMGMAKYRQLREQAIAKGYKV